MAEDVGAEDFAEGRLRGLVTCFSIKSRGLGFCDSANMATSEGRIGDRVYWLHNCSPDSLRPVYNLGARDSSIEDQYIELRYRGQKRLCSILNGAEMCEVKLLGLKDYAASKERLSARIMVYMIMNQLDRVPTLLMRASGYYKLKLMRGSSCIEEFVNKSAAYGEADSAIRN